MYVHLVGYTERIFLFRNVHLVVFEFLVSSKIVYMKMDYFNNIVVKTQII